MSDHQLTRRDILLGTAATIFLKGAPVSEATDSSICFLSAVEMARLIRAKKLSAREALAAHLKQIERVNPKVNAIVTLVPDMAADAAAKADEAQAHGEKLGPLHGLPVAHKDLLETRGIRTTFGSPLFKDYIPVEDDIVAERMKRAARSPSARPTLRNSARARKPSTKSSARPAIPTT
jgi:amidase